MAKPHQRAFALILALLFLLTAVGSGAAVIWQMNQDSKQNQQASTDQTTQDQQTDATQQQQPKEGALQGTKLADFTPIATVDKLQIIDIKEGTGEVVKEHATVTAHYTGALVKDGTIFQSSKDMGQPIEFSLDGVIKGWGQGVPGMKVGGTRRLIIPAELAYGANSPDPTTIPPNSALVFDIEMTAVKNP